MKLLTNLTFVALALSIATSATAGQLPQVPNPVVALTTNESTSTESAYAERLLKYRRLTVKQKSVFDGMVKHHNKVIKVLKLNSEIKAAVTLAAVDRCREQGYDDNSMHQCDLQLQAKQRQLEVLDENLHYLEMANSIENSYLDSINN